MRKPLVWAVALVLSLLGLMAGMPVLTQSASSTQVDRQDAGTLLQSVSIPAAADAETWSCWPDNYGSGPSLALAYGVGPTSEYAAFSLVRFDLASALPPNAIIDSATIQLYLASVDPGSTLPIQAGAFFVTSNWNEGTVTWNTRPSSENTGTGTQIVSGGGWHSWNATSFATAWQADPAHNYGVELRGPLSVALYCVRFVSREGGGNGPRLVVNYHMPPTTPTPTPVCWRLQGKVFDADYPGETQPLQGIDLKLVGSNSPYPASGTQLGMQTTNSDGWYGLRACDQPPTYNYDSIQLQVPTGWEAVNATSVDGEVKAGNTVIEFAWPLQGQDLTGNKFWIRQIPGPTPTPTATPRPPEGCENILPNGSFESGIVSPWWTRWAARVSSQYAHDGTKSVLLVEANDQEGELIGRVDLPTGADSVTLRYWWRVETQDPEAHTDVMGVLVEPGGASYQVAHYSGVDNPGSWNLGEADLSAYAGENLILIFQAHNGPTNPSEWYVDEVEIEVCGEGWGGYKLFVPLAVKGG